jgi:hypothetical protein
MELLNVDFFQFRVFLLPDSVREEQLRKLKDILCRLNLQPGHSELIKKVKGAETWATPYGQSLLCGKFIGHITGKYALSKFH